MTRYSGLLFWATLYIQWHRNEFESGGGGTDRAPTLFLALKAQLVVLVSAFVMISTVWSVSCLLFFYSRCPRAQSFVKVGARAPRAPWNRRHCIYLSLFAQKAQKHNILNITRARQPIFFI